MSQASKKVGPRTPEYRWKLSWECEGNHGITQRSINLARVAAEAVRNVFAAVDLIGHRCGSGPRLLQK